MPDYEIVCWNETNFHITSIPFVAETCKAKKYGFTVDYLRLHALYNYGGIYLDTDVIVTKTFDTFLNNDLFSAVEYHPGIIERENTFSLLDDDGLPRYECDGVPGIGILVAIMGSIKKHPFIETCLDFYRNYHFIQPDGTYNMKVAPAIYAEIARKYGFRYKNTLQKVQNNMVFYPSSFFAGEANEFVDGAYALHYCENSWVDRSFYTRLRNKITKNNMLRKVLGKKACVDVDKIIERIIGEKKKNGT
jgi:mannosyltransferase OCH1-like enzyme